jgi:heat-inducible transcriptional repressor
MSDLPRRAQKILYDAVVTEYLHGGDAVGSRNLTRRHDLGLSPATVRNVMADLEELGLLEQRHTSAGRVPTPTGLRFFIDSLLKVRGLSAREKDDIRDRVAAPTPEEVVQRASRLLSDLTQHAAVIVTPDPTHQRLDRIEFLPLRDGKLIAILVTTDGRIENRLLSEISVDPRSLERIHVYLNQLFSGMTLDEVRDRVIRELAELRANSNPEPANAAAIELGHAVFVGPERSAGVVVSGQANILDTGDAGTDLAGARELLRTLEDKETLIKLLERTRTAEGIHVFLGAETATAALMTSSVVASSYGPEERPLGALAVIGPMRMNYGKVMSVVDVTADIVTQLLADLNG